MVIKQKDIIEEDIEAILKRKENKETNLLSVAPVPLVISKEETSEESGSSKTGVSDTDRFFNSETPSFRSKSTKEVLEGGKVKEKWRAVERRCEINQDEIPLSILVMEAMCAQWEESSSFSISLVEAYQNLFAVCACVEREVNACATIDEQTRTGGIFISTQQFRAIRNGLACIRSKKAEIVQCTFDGII